MMRMKKFSNQRIFKKIKDSAGNVKKESVHVFKSRIFQGFGGSGRLREKGQGF